MKARRFPRAILRFISPFSPLIREVLEMRSLWDTPHRVDGSALRAVLPDYADTTLAAAMADILRPEPPPSAP